MPTRIDWTDGFGNQHESLPLSLFWFDGMEWAVVSGDDGQPRLLCIVKRDYYPKTGRARLEGITQP